MALITLLDAQLAFGHVALLDHAGFSLETSERVGLIGRNGTGKSSMLKILAGMEKPDDGSLQALMTDADGQHHPLGLPPHKVDWRHIAAVRQAARERLAPQFAEILEKTAQPFIQPIYDCCSQRLAFGRIALMGDAAFVARPHVGMGVTKAAQDAMALADSIDAHGATPLALTAFEAARLAPGQAVIARARRLGAYLQASAGGLAAAARDPRDVMMDTAIDLSPAPMHPAAVGAH